jgi:hypothetical protein
MVRNLFRLESSTTKFAVEITLNSQRGATFGPRMFNHLNIRSFEILNSFGTSCGFAFKLSRFPWHQACRQQRGVLGSGAECVEATS